jgi:hypothetical protein
MLPTPLPLRFSSFSSFLGLTASPSFFFFETRDLLLGFARFRRCGSRPSMAARNRE